VLPWGGRLCFVLVQVTARGMELRFTRINLHRSSFVDNRKDRELGMGQGITRR